MCKTPWAILSLAAFLVLGTEARAQPVDDIVAALRELAANVLSPQMIKPGELRDMLGKDVRARRDAANRSETAAWKAIETKEDWEKYRDVRLAALRESLGSFPPPPKSVKVQTTGTLEGDGFTISNIVYESRPGLLVTANLYQPDPPRTSMPGMIICHSHHNPKSQGELQDMGMTWARQGCLVLIMDQLGHGERRQHPFTDAGKYPGSFRVGRQDYYFRWNTGMQLHLIGDSLIGWMAWDMMRGVDVLLSQKGVDPKRIVLLGAVAGGGDPCAVTAALDKRIAAATPFNFGGPQPESRYPLPADAEESFNYAGGGSWESTRNLRLACRDGFMPWVIVGSLAPRGLLYGHEFAWDLPHDPVWKRLQKIYGFYDAVDHLAFSAGKGRVSGKPPESTHCNNIGPPHRKFIYPVLKQWFDIPVPDKECQKRFPAEALLCARPGSGIELKPMIALAGKLAAERIDAARQKLDALPREQRLGRLQQAWSKLLGDVAPRKVNVIRPGDDRLGHGMRLRSVVLREEPGASGSPIYVPLLLLLPGRERRKFPVVVAIAQQGKDGFLKHRAEIIARLLADDIAVCLPDLRGTGATRPGDSSRGKNSADTAFSATTLMLGDTMLGARLRDLRSVLAFLRKEGCDADHTALWGDSFAPVTRADARAAVPLDADKLPPNSEPLGGMLTLFGALYEKDVRAVYARGGLVSYASLLDSQFCYFPHDVVVPGALTAGDLADVAAALAPRAVRLEGMVNGLNQLVTSPALERAFQPALRAHQDGAGKLQLNVEYGTENDVAHWLVRRLK